MLSIVPREDAFGWSINREDGGIAIDLVIARDPVTGARVAFAVGERDVATVGIPYLYPFVVSAFGDVVFPHVFVACVWSTLDGEAVSITQQTHISFRGLAVDAVVILRHAAQIDQCSYVAPLQCDTRAAGPQERFEQIAAVIVVLGATLFDRCISDPDTWIAQAGYIVPAEEELVATIALQVNVEAEVATVRVRLVFKRSVGIPVIVDFGADAALLAVFDSGPYVGGIAAILDEVVVTLVGTHRQLAQDHLPALHSVPTRRVNKLCGHA